jgi:hypothetical protein
MWAMRARCAIGARRGDVHSVGIAVAGQRVMPRVIFAAFALTIVIPGPREARGKGTQQRARPRALEMTCARMKRLIQRADARWLGPLPAR